MKKVIKEVSGFKGKEVGASTEITLTKGENIVMKIWSILFIGLILWIMVDSIINKEPSPLLMFGGILISILSFLALAGIMFWRHRGEAKDNLSTYNEDVNTFKKED